MVTRWNATQADRDACPHKSTSLPSGNEWETCDRCGSILRRTLDDVTVVSRELSRISDDARAEIAERMWTIAVRFGADRSCAACDKVVRKIANGRDEGMSCGRHCMTALSRRPDSPGWWRLRAIGGSDRSPVLEWKTVWVMHDGVLGLAFDDVKRGRVSIDEYEWDGQTTRPDTK